MKKTTLLLAVILILSAGSVNAEARGLNTSALLKAVRITQTQTIKSGSYQSALDFLKKFGITVDKNGRVTMPVQTAAPAAKPTAVPTAKPAATKAPAATAKPAKTQMPIATPAAQTPKPTAKPTIVPTAKPTAAPTAKPTPTQAPASVSSETAMEQEVLRLVNAERAKYGLNPLTWAEDLAKVARAHSADMIRRNFFDHTNPDGLSPFDRMRRAGISYRAAAENIAYGQRDAASVMNAWMNSSGHRKNILGSSYKELGVGAVRKSGGTIYWTQEFVAR